MSASCIVYHRVAGISLSQQKRSFKLRTELKFDFFSWNQTIGSDHLIGSEAINSLNSCIEAEHIQVGFGLFTFENVSRNFDYFAALLAITILALVLPRPNL